VKTINKISFRIIIQRLIISIGLILFIRFGSFLPIPGINHLDLALFIQTNPFARNLIRSFSTDNTFVIGLFTLGILPYINASIFAQIFIAFSPSLSKLQKEGDLNARRSLNRLTRFICLIWAIIDSLAIVIFLRQAIFNWNFKFALETTVWLTTGAMIVLWLSELITDHGLGNGPSLLVYTNISASFPNLCQKILTENNSTGITSLSLILLITISVFGTILLQEGIRKIPLLSAFELNLNSSRRVSYNQVELYLPFKLNQAGIMPIILTTAILVIPNYVINLGILPIKILPNFGILSILLYWSTFFMLIIIISLLYSNIILNPKDISDQLLKSAIVIPNIETGPETTYYLKNVMSRITILGALILALLATLPNLLETIFNIENLNGLSTTSLLIMTGVLIDLSKEIDDIIYSNIYKK